MIGYPYGQAPFDGYGNAFGRCRFLAIPLRRRVFPMRRFPRVRLAFRFGDPGFGAMPPAGAAPGQQVIYDGLGNPVGLIPAIAAIAAKVLPIAVKALPFITKALPAITQVLPALAPLPAPTPGAPAPPTVPSPTVQVVTPQTAVRIRPLRPCPPPTMEERRRLYPPPPPRISRRRRIIMRVRG
jgi:hypothetical protein